MEIYCLLCNNLLTPLQVTVLSAVSFTCLELRRHWWNTRAFPEESDPKPSYGKTPKKISTAALLPVGTAEWAAKPVWELVKLVWEKKKGASGRQYWSGDLPGMQQGVRDAGWQMSQRQPGKTQLWIYPEDAAEGVELWRAPSGLPSQRCWNTIGYLPLYVYPSC